MQVCKMYDNEIHTELQICLAQKCHWTTLQQQLLTCHDNSIKQDKASSLSIRSSSTLFHIISEMILQFKKYSLELGWILIKYDQYVSSREIWREVKRDGRKGYRDWKKDDISWVIEMQSKWRTSREAGRCVIDWQSHDRFHISTQEFDSKCIDKCSLALRKGRMCLINVQNKEYMFED